MVKVFIARHPTEAHLVRSLLELEGIAVEVRGEALYGALGEIAIDSYSLPSVWVQDDSQAGKAMEVVERYLKGQGSPDSGGKPWICPKCRETIESQFTSCWRCGNGREQDNRGNADNEVQANVQSIADGPRSLNVNMNVLYRYLVIASFILYTIWFFMPYFWHSIYDQNTLEVLSWSGYGGLIENNNWLAYSFLFLYCITYCGLLYFKPWARLAYVVLVIVSFITASISGVIVQTAFGYVLDTLIYLIDGSIIALMYFTNLSYEFGAPPLMPTLGREEMT